NGAGYYAFYCLAMDNSGNVQEIPTYQECAYDNITPESNVNPLHYWQSTATFVITANASDNISGVSSVELYYNYSVDNSTWNSWINFGLGSYNSTNDLWEWNFTAEGDGYYMFYSIAVDNATNTESLPVTTDAIAGIDTMPPSSYVNVISPYWNTIGTVDIVVTASDENTTGGESGIKEVTLYYRNSTDNVSWNAWTLYSVNATVAPYQWSFVSTGDSYYEFYSIATDNASNIELPPATNDTLCGIDTTMPVANAGADQIVNEDTLVTFDGSGSTDNIGIGNYTWTFTDQGIPVTLYGANPSYTFYTPGNYTVLLNVTDYAGNWDTDTMWVNVTDITPPNLTVTPAHYTSNLTPLISASITDIISGVNASSIVLIVNGT
ncbi:PKD domain-containing protein, partial [archaeon]|nr:PKD domain-containing protein [archaeon]